jgi:hypothetical protein
VAEPNAAYHHTQTGYVILGSFAIGLLIVVLGYRSVGNTTPPGATRTAILSIVFVIAVLVAIVSLMFSSLTIEIANGELRWRFTASFIHGSVALRDIEAATQVRSSPAYGWGVRKTPEGALYCVSGLDAIRVETREGRTINLGTNEPAKLLAAIESARAATRSK